ncbi:hypothetical protein NLJ89_g10204 [Agrocybe chaxingu]|uniref:Scamp-domain-containing protein n=1 Tax=Agrocybe chaxingu TaxID=84603 RepID=A0A9W8JZ49_9AGAR|nr:hypothetical protein NLJ89_g10204 [Agrocybe chaxingu]
MTDYTHNPFASTHSLDTNPFDDPPQRSSPAADARLEEIRRREQDLARREAELNNKAEHIRRHGRNNFPPFFPLIFHSIPDEIPEASRPLITRLFQLWLVLGATTVVNLVACIIALISGSSTGGADLGGSIGYLIFIPVLAFLLWYRPIYNGYMKVMQIDRSCRICPTSQSEQRVPTADLYFFFCGFHLLYSIYMIIGIPSTGSAGLFLTIRFFSNRHWVAAVFGVIATVGWSVQGFGNAYYYREIYNHHTAAGHTMEKAKTELASHGAKAYFTRG